MYSDSALDQIRRLNSTTGSFSSITETSQAFISPVESFKAEQLSDVYESSDREDTYARKFAAFDSELGQLYQQVLETQRRTTSHPHKSVLPNIRQLYDHLMRKLAPDDAVTDTCINS